MSRYLFFLRSYNDTDNIVPAVWFLLEGHPECSADLVYYNFEFQFLEHPYLQALTLEFSDRVRVHWMGTFLGLEYEQMSSKPPISAEQTARIRKTYRFDAAAYDRMFGFEPKPGDQDNVSFALRRRLVEGWRRLRSAKSAQKQRILTIEDLVRVTTDLTSSPEIRPEIWDDFVAWLVGERPSPRVAVFDHQRSATLKNLIAALRRSGVQTVLRLPVSPIMNINVLRDSNTLFTKLDRAALETEMDFTRFDALSFTDSYYPTSVSHFFKEMGWGDPLARGYHVLGSIRYCPEWLAVRPSLPPFSSSDGDDRIKVAFFLSRRRTNTFWDEVQRAVHIIDRFPRFRLVVQPHPRGAEPAFEVKGSKAKICIDVPAESLVKWADVVMLWGSSVGIEALLANKPVLCLDYLNANRNLYELMDAAWILRCPDDLALALAAIQRDPNSYPRRCQNVARLLREIVLAGGGKSVPERYLDFLCDGDALRMSAMSRNGEGPDVQ